MASSFTPTGATGGAFVCEAGDYAIGRSSVTTAAPTTEVTFRFNVARRPLVMRVGSSAGGQQIVEDITFQPGDYVHTFTPGASPYYIEFQLREVGQAVLSGLARVAPGLLSLPTPFDGATLRSIRSEQSLNTMWLADGRNNPRVLTRLGTTSWGLRLFQPKDGPFEENEVSGITLTPSAKTGTSTVTASGPVFKATDAGSLIRLTQAGQYETASGNALNVTSDTIRVSGTGAAVRTFYYAISGTFVASVTLQRSVGSEANWTDVVTVTSATSTSLNDTLDGQIVYYRLKVTAWTSGTAVMELTYSGGVTYGVGRIFSVTADNAVTVDVLEPFAATTATSIWARGSWSDRYGWPSFPALFDGRLSFLRAGRRWQSVSDDYESFDLGSQADRAISGTIPGQMNIPRWAKARDRLMIGTGGGEGYISAGRDDEVMIPDNARARIRTDRGSLDADAALVDGAPAFIHRSGRKINLMVWDGNGYSLVNLSRLHRDIAGVGTGSLLELAYQHEPEPRLYAVRDDGQCATMLLSVAEQVGGWTRINPTREIFEILTRSGDTIVTRSGDTIVARSYAQIESVCVVPGTPEDHVYRVVSRTIGGSTVRCVEKQARERWTSSSAAWRLEAALEYSGSSTSTLTGLNHLEGLSVYVWGNGRVSGPHTVSGGSVTTSFPVTYAIVGLKYQGFYRGPRAPNITKTKKIERLGIVLHNTVGGGVSWGQDFDEMSTLDDRSREDATYDSALPVYSEDVEFPLSGSWSTDARVCVRFEGIGPATVLGLAVTTAS